MDLEIAVHTVLGGHDANDRLYDGCVFGLVYSYVD